MNEKEFEEKKKQPKEKSRSEDVFMMCIKPFEAGWDWLRTLKQRQMT